MRPKGDRSIQCACTISLEKHSVMSIVYCITLHVHVGGIRNKREMEICLTDSNAEELEYDEPKFPSSVYSLQLEACPAYKTSET